jgi:hypothetical protein
MKFLLLQAYVERRFNFGEKVDNNTTNEIDWTKKESVSYFEEKQCMWQDLWKSIADMDKPSHFRVRVFDVL